MCPPLISGPLGARGSFGIAGRRPQGAGWGQGARGGDGSGRARARARARRAAAPGTRGDSAGASGERRLSPAPAPGRAQPRLLRLPPQPSAASAARQSLEDENKERRGRKGRKKKKLMTHNCHDSGIGPGQLFYIPGMYSMQISTKGRHSFSIVDPEGNQISLWQPW